ncbi:hypothetical protein jhhlp_008636 [Lomentospora prolificans]|uniref:Rhomboid-type serine protease n=1 Tax=Lomentospora prolificans TaxID=41688 RepID=A0A2N3MYM9_9PEZI|nr:hypothetical protein jhhlp_008636 [Lomentospora prolificans]
MAANDYYSGYGASGPNDRNNYSDNNIRPAASSSSGGYIPSPSPLSYTQHDPYSPSPTPVQRPAHGATHASPFDTVFDDNVYPMNNRHNNSSTDFGTYNNSNMNLPQQQDTAYYGPGRGSPDAGRAEDIPLQDRPNKDVEFGNDHVYDAPDSGRPTPTQRKKKRKGNIRLGQLGMFGAERKRIPWVVYIFTLVQIAVFIGEIARNAVLTGSPIMIKPTFNPMIGPSTFVLINMGARYAPCMHNIDAIQGSVKVITWPCPNTTTTAAECTLSEACGLGGVPEPDHTGNKDQSPEPNQWFRFIIPIFMHAGLIHIGFNMLLQMTIGKEMEKAIGSLRFILVYMSSGIFGNIMGGNYAADGLPSTGASGALFGVIALVLLDLLYSWQERRNPVKDLLFILLDIVISFVLGLLPGLDNFAHIGGFVMGVGLGICVLHSPNALRRRLGQDTSYSAVRDGAARGHSFLKNPAGFFKGRKPLWWVWWMIRAGCLISVTVAFIVLLNNFYVDRNTCSWCKYLSCLPVSDWCELGNLEIEDTNQTETKRAMDAMFARLF